jgi:hypothetical protein
MTGMATPAASMRSDRRRLLKGVVMASHSVVVLVNNAGDTPTDPPAGPESVPSISKCRH